jgi:hypothetical protein
MNDVQAQDAEIERLEQLLSNKDQEIARLLSDLTEKSRELKKAKANARKQQRQTAAPAKRVTDEEIQRGPSRYKLKMDDLRELSMRSMRWNNLGESTMQRATEQSSL